jgi:hypothetical protein
VSAPIAGGAGEGAVGATEETGRDGAARARTAACDVDVCR